MCLGRVGMAGGETKACDKEIGGGFATGLCASLKRHIACCSACHPSRRNACPRFPPGTPLCVSSRRGPRTIGPRICHPSV